MHFTTQVIALLSALSSTSLASDVYSSFFDDKGAKIGSHNFDVDNEGCFTNYPVSQVSFSQAAVADFADGPYLLLDGVQGGRLQGRQHYPGVQTCQYPERQVSSE